MAPSLGELVAPGRCALLLQEVQNGVVGPDSVLEELAKAARAQVFSDVDSAYATVDSTIILLQPYKDRYLKQATSVRDTIEFSYQHGAASLLEFLNAQADYRSVQVTYLNLVGSYLEAANQLNLAVGSEVIP